MDGNRPKWDEYFMLVAKAVSTRSTCLARPVGAVIVKDHRIVATGYNGVPSGYVHCLDQGYCRLGLQQCNKGVLPSRAIHAEVNAIGQCAKNGVSTDGASIYTTFEPCLSCMKLIVAAGIKEVYFREANPNAVGNLDIFGRSELIYKQIDVAL